MLPAALIDDWERAIDVAGRALEASLLAKVFTPADQLQFRRALQVEREWLRNLRLVEGVTHERPAPKISGSASRHEGSAQTRRARSGSSLRRSRACASPDPGVYRPARPQSRKPLVAARAR
jgi:hypothetical protein